MGTAPEPAREGRPELLYADSKLYFAGIEADLRSGELTANGRKVYLQQQPLEVLRMLLERPGEMVSREELRERLWPADTFVDFDHGLNKAVQKLRTALGDSSDRPHFIETLPRRGYRFVARLESPPPVAVPPVVRPSRGARAWKWALPFCLVAIILGLLAYGFRPSSRRPPKPGEVQRLAVLPFKNLSGNPEQDFFSDGMTEEMIVHLSRYAPSRLAVIARTSAMAYKDSRKTVSEIGRELDVDYILEGSIRREAERVRITAQLIDARDQSHLWSESYEHEMSGIIPVQKDIAANVAREIGLHLNHRASAVARTRQVQPQAYEAFLRGLSLWHSGRQDALPGCVTQFQRAIALQPDYAEAYAWLAFSYNRMASSELLPPREGYPLAKAAAHKAIEIDPALPEGHAALGFVLRNYEWDWAGAERELQTALQADANNAVSNHVYGLYLSTVGRHDEAVAAINRAAVLDPLSSSVASGRALVYVNARRFAEARAAVESHRDLHHANPVWWGQFLVATHEYPQALQEFARQPQKPPALADLAGSAQAYAGMGDIPKARALLRELKAHPQARATLSPYIARIHGQLGDMDEAFQWLDIAIEERAARVIFLKVDPAWDSLRPDPRFQQALRRMNLAE